MIKTTSELKTTSDLRDEMNQLYKDLKDGKVTNTAARARTQVAKVLLDTLKIEITAAALGRQFSAVRFDETGANIPAQSELKRVA